MREAFRLVPSVKMLTDRDDTAELMLYGEIISDMPEDWKWSKEDKSAADLDKDIKKIRESGAKNLNIRINSPGGVCSEAIAMRSIICNAGFEKITIRIEGMCASAATDIATIPGADVEITPGSEYMIHNPWTFAWGNANEMERTIEHLRQLEKTSRQMYAQRSGQSDEQIKEWMDAETWFSAEDAVKYGFCDRVTEEAAAPAAASANMMRVMRGMYNRIPDAVQEIPDEDVRNEAPVAGDSSENNPTEDTDMDIKDLSMEALASENPGLLEQIRQEAVTAERQRLEDIDALTMQGYEEMAAKAKAEGTSAMDFQKAVVAAQKQKGADFIANRKAETAPVQEVAAAAAEDGNSEEDEINAFAESMKELYAKSHEDMGGMY